MRKRLNKEFRALLPACCLLAATVVTFPTWINFDPGFMVFLLYVACFILGATPFGHEYSHQTMSLLLSQPISRRRLWYEKMGIFGLALVIPALLAVLYFMSMDLHNVRHVNNDSLESVLILLVIIVCSWGASPCLSLLLKDTVATVVLAPMLPLGMCIVLWGLSKLAFPALMAEFTSGQTGILFFAFPTIVYTALMYLLGCRQFQRLEAIDALGKDINLPAWLRAPFSRILSFRWGGSPGTLSSLIRKELHLQKVNFLLAGVFCLGIFAIAVFHWLRPETAAGIENVPMLLFWFILPFTIGAVAVAEERNYGLLEWHLMLPPSRLKQWWLKMAVTFSTLTLLGVILPWGMFLLGRAELDLFNSSNALSQAGFLKFTPPLFLVTLIAVHASSFSSNTMRAVLSALGIGLASWLFIELIYWWFRATYVGSNYVMENIGDLFLSLTEEGNLYVCTLPLIVLSFGLILHLSYRNYQRIRSSLSTLASIPLIVIASSLMIFLDAAVISHFAH